MGGVDPALAAGRAEIEALGLPRTRGDLDAGFDKHAVPLARAGARVLAIDASAELNASLLRLAEGLPITHLASFDAVDALCRAACSALAPGGTFEIA